jgi:predicted deacylase
MLLMASAALADQATTAATPEATANPATAPVSATPVPAPAVDLKKEVTEPGTAPVIETPAADHDDDEAEPEAAAPAATPAPAPAPAVEPTPDAKAKRKAGPKSATPAAKAAPADKTRPVDKKGSAAKPVQPAAPATPAADAPAAVPAASNPEAAHLLKDINQVAPPPVAADGTAQPAAAAEQPQSVVAPPATQKPFVMLGSEVAPGIATRLSWKPRVTFSGIEAPTPVLVINGVKPGPVLCLTGAVHGDELNGIEIVRRVMYDIDPQKLSGTLVGVPIVNLQGFERGTRYLPDRRDLNRYFPGNPKGSMASRIAHSLYREVIVHCNGLVDLHTASFHRTNLPQVRADMRNESVAKFTEGFDKMVVVHNKGGAGTLRRAAVNDGIPAVTLETGEPMRLQEDKVQAGVRSIHSLLEKQGMYSRMFSWGEPEPVYYKSRWVRTHHGGILMSTAKLGTRVRKGDVLGTVTDPITNQSEAIKSPFDGRVVGMAVNQVVMPGFAAYHMGVDASEKTVAEPEAADPATAAEAENDQINEDLAPEE